jgi:thiol-disulfide isomerase/thioredoxin
MRNVMYRFFLLLFLTVPSVFSQDQKPDSAQNIVRVAMVKAIATDKNILITFNASWCIWCKWLETALESPDLKPIMEKYYTIAKLDVKEFGKKIQMLENPGGQQLLEEMGGSKSGLPFIAILNKKGTMIANSNMMPKKQNIGYPASKEQIAAFLQLLKKTAQRMTDKQVAVISSYLKKNAQQ